MCWFISIPLSATQTLVTQHIRPYHELTSAREETRPGEERGGDEREYATSHGTVLTQTVVSCSVGLQAE